MLTFAANAEAGITLLSRQSTLVATSAQASIDASSSLDTADVFAEQIGTPNGPIDGIICLAHQYSNPGLASGELLGVFGEGETHAGVLEGTGSSQSTSTMKVLFNVGQEGANYELGAAMGASGGSSVEVSLYNVDSTGGMMSNPLITAAIDTSVNDGKTIDESGVLNNGNYLLLVSADAQDVAGDDQASAYYNFNLQFSEATTPGEVAAVPLPSAVVGGGTTMMLLAAYRMAQVARRRLRLAA